MLLEARVISIKARVSLVRGLLGWVLSVVSSWLAWGFKSTQPIGNHSESDDCPKLCIGPVHMIIFCLNQICIHV